MSVAADIVSSWRRPRRVLRRHLAAGPREDRALAFLMLGCALIGLSQLPRLVRADAAGGDMGLLLAGVIMAWLFIAPLALYLVAAISHVLARLFGGRGGWFGARLALFWAVLAAAPAWLVWGASVGYAGQGAPVTQVLGAIALGAFVLIWGAGLIEAEFGADGA